MKHGPWNPKESWLAVWAYDRLDAQRHLQVESLVRELASHLDRDVQDVEQVLREVAACDGRPADQKPLKASDRIQGKLRFVFAEYWGDREAARKRAATLKKTGMELAEEPERAPRKDPLEVWRGVIPRIQEDPTSTGEVSRILHNGLRLITKRKGTPSGIPLNLLVDSLQPPLSGKPKVRGSLFHRISQLGIGVVWHAVAKRGDRESPPDFTSGSFAFKIPFIEALQSPKHIQALMKLLAPLCPQETAEGPVPQAKTAGDKRNGSPVPPAAVEGHVLQEAIERLRQAEEAEAKARRAAPTPWEVLTVQDLEGLRGAAVGLDAPFGRYSEGLKRLASLPRQMKDLWSAQPLPGDTLKPLAGAARELANRTSRLKAPAPPDPEAFQKAKRRWKEAPDDLWRLDRREIRLLCQHPSTSLDPAWVRALAQPDGPALRRSWVEGALGHYLAHWRAMPNPEALEAALSGLLERLQATQPGAKEMVRACTPLIGPDAPSRLVASLDRPLEQWGSTLENLALAREVGLGQAFLAEVFRTWVDGVLRPRQSRGVAELREEVQFAFRTLMLEHALPETDFREAVSALILLPRMDTNPEWKEMLVEEVLRHPRLGDPRRQEHHWHSIRPARDRVISWMAAKDLRLFYDSVVADHADDQGRKAFWLRYVDRVADFRLVLCEDDKLRLRGVFGPGKGHAAEMEGARVSAFILRFKPKRGGEDLICVEFSKTGYSLYVYGASAFEAGIGRMDAISFRVGAEPRNLRNREYAQQRIPHMGAWQYQAEDLLHAYGIEPA